jgi:putative peptidoglycan lipid II flippase
VALLVAVALVVVVIVVVNRGSSKHGGAPAPPTSTTLAAVGIQSASVFHLERNADDAANVGFAIDGNPATAWQTDHYFGPNFANLRHGLGLALTLNSSATLHTLTVLSYTKGWSAEVYVAAAVPNPAALAPWGPPVDSKQNISGPTTTFNLHGQTGGAVLLWLTDLGPTFQTSIAEVTIR